MDKRVNIEQEEAVYKAIDKGWKDFYLEDAKKSKFHAYLGRSLKMDGHKCLILQNISKEKISLCYSFQILR